MDNITFVNKIEDIAKNYKTLYVMGCFGSPMTDANKSRYTTNHSYNKQPSRTAMIKAASSDTFGFDCVNLIKAVLWGWCGDKNATYGGAKYASNGVPDIDADTMIKKCQDASSSNWNSIEKGEVVWMSGHIGVYVGNGKVVECSPKWNNCVQYSNLGNLGFTSGNSRIWTKHGHIPYITYIKDTVDSVVKDKEKEVKVMYKSLDEVPEYAKEAIDYYLKNGFIQGIGGGNLNLSEDMLRILVILYRIIKKGV